ncbi:MAG: low molecular weight phosphatase family protein [Deltaproteobacteria bacterium]|nr:low molecular weight phosphatase family protein [Deltaproteobacteria bacterium]
MHRQLVSSALALMITHEASTGKMRQKPNFEADLPKLLFVCHGNTCRSVMAAALARRRFGNTVTVSSAGLHPQKVSDAKMAIQTLKMCFGIDASSHIPKAVTDLQLDNFDYVVAVDKSIAKRLSAVPLERLIVWNIPDPWGDDLLEYRSAAFRINQEVSKLATVLKK